MNNTFTELDQQKIVDLLNLIATNAKFTLDTKDIIKYYGLLSWAQNDLLKKIEANVFEIKNIKEVNPEEKKPKKGSVNIPAKVVK